MRILIVTPARSFQDVHIKVMEGIRSLNLGEHIVDWILLTEQKYKGTDQGSREGNLRLKLEYGRKIFLENNYDKMMIVESDNVIPSHTLLDLIKTPGDISATLIMDRPSMVHGQYEWNLVRQTGSAFNKNALELIRKKEPFIITGATGYHCIMIDRKVLEKTEFKATDIHSYINWRGLGFQIYCNPLINVGHLDHKKIYKKEIDGEKVIIFEA